MRFNLVAWLDTILSPPRGLEPRKFPSGSPHMAYELSREQLMHQHLARQAVDDKVALVLGFSGALLSVLAAFLVLAEQPIGRDVVGLISGSAGLFLLSTISGLYALWPRGFKGLSWESMKVLSDARYDERDVLWEATFTLHDATVINDAIIGVKSIILRMMLFVFATQAGLLTAAALLLAL